MQHIQRIAKDFRNSWSAVDELDLGNNMQLTISTNRTSSGSVATVAQVGRVEGDFVSHMLYQDYRKILVCTKHGRVTKNVVVQQHEAAIADLESVKSAALAHYAQELATA